MPDRTKDLFSSRWALLLVALGMAVGTGNIWRFPRIMAKFDGGGTFLIPWLLFLFTWSIPLLIVEFSIGRKTRRGVVGSLGAMMGEKRTWLGAFVALCTTLIMCYYAVVAGWCGIYVVEALGGAPVGLARDLPRVGRVVLAVEPRLGAGSRQGLRDRPHQLGARPRADGDDLLLERPLLHRAARAREGLRHGHREAQRLDEVARVGVLRKLEQEVAHRSLS